MAYTYGAFPTTGADYSLWGSTGDVNPYQTTPNLYNPIVPTQPTAPSLLPSNVASVLPGGSESWVDPTTGGYGPGALMDSPKASAYMTNFFSPDYYDRSWYDYLPGVTTGNFLSGLATNLGADWENAQLTSTDYFGNPVASGTTVGDLADTWTYTESDFGDWGGGDGGWDSYSDFQDDTGIGTSEWDSSSSDFSW